MHEPSTMSMSHASVHKCTTAQRRLPQQCEIDKSESSNLGGRLSLHRETSPGGQIISRPYAPAEPLVDLQGHKKTGGRRPTAPIIETPGVSFLGGSTAPRGNPEEPGKCQVWVFLGFPGFGPESAPSPYFLGKMAVRTRPRTLRGEGHQDKNKKSS